jgi:hypothetical protein
MVTDEMDRREYPSFEALDFRPQGDGGAGAEGVDGRVDDKVLWLACRVQT